ncbi:MAG: glycosyltransferase family 39 protein [Betaproteobacteria bacterium]|nr:MAG: glycosyltransferase family 39 protein [Betaproteobacteria bacterium]
MNGRSAALWALLAVLWFGTLGIRPLYKADESRYGEIAREMVASGDWITPRLNGFKYFEKPPLQYWATAVFFHVFGERDWAARLWTALLGFAGIAMVLYAANRLFGAPIGYYAAAVLAGSPLYVLLGQVNTLDMSVSFFLSGAIFAFALGHMLLFWAACALAVLSKGLIGIVLPLAALALYMLLKRNWALMRRLRIVPGALLFLAIAAPWFIAVSAANAEFAHFFFVQEHFQRFTTEMHQRAHPAWYFIPVLAAGFAPWLVPLGHAAVRAVKERNDAELLLWAWALVVFVFFSASGSKLPPYILPIFPALAVLAARSLSRGVLVAQSLVTLPVALGAGLAVHRLASGGPYAGYASWILVAALVLAAAAAAALFMAWRQRLAGAVLALAIGGLVATQIGLAGHRTLSERFSVASTVAALPEQPPADAPVFAVDMYDHTLPWSLKRTVTMVGYRDELGDAVDWERAKFVPDLLSFASRWNAAPQAWAFIPLAEAERLPRELGIRVQVMARGAQYAIVKKP